MILRGWEIEGFGILRGASMDGLDGGLTLLLGPNEAGKSTLLAFLRFVLFGFARGDQQKYPPLAGGRHGGRLRFEDGAGLWTVERIQGQRPRVFAPDGRELGEEVLRERLGGVDAGIFRNVFAFSLLELSDLATLDAEGVRERLYSAGITGAGRSAAAVLAELRKASDRYLRPRSHEGQINRLSEELAEARRDLADATERARGYAALASRVAAAEARAEELRDQQRVLRERIGHIERLQSLFVPWNRLRRLELEIAQRMEPPSFAPDLAAAVERLQAEVEAESARSSQLADALREAESCVEAATAQLDAPVLEVAQALERVAEGTALQRDRLRRRAALDRTAAVQEAAVAAAAQALGAAADTSAAGADAAGRRALDDALEAVREAGLDRRERAAALDAAERRAAEAAAAAKDAEGRAQAYAGLPDPLELRAQEEALVRLREALESQARARVRVLWPGFVAAALLVVGLIGVVLGQWAVAGAVPVGIGAGLVVALGAPGRDLRRASAELRASAEAAGLPGPVGSGDVAAALGRLHLLADRAREAAAVRTRLEEEIWARETADREGAAARAALQAAAEAEEAALGRLKDLQAAAGVPRDVSPQHIAAYVAGLAEIHKARAELAKTRELQAALDGEIEDWRARAERVQAELQLPPLAAEALPDALDGLLARLSAAREARAALGLLQAEAERTRLQLDEAQGRAERARSELAAALGLLGLATIEDFARVLAEGQAYRDLKSGLEIARADFCDQAGDGWRDVAAELGQGSPESWQADLADLAVQARELEEQRDQTLREAQDGLREREELAASADVPRRAALVAELEEELGRAAEAWRQQALAQRLLERTLETYVRDRQPEVLRVASEAFSGVTGGRYREVRQRGDGQDLVAMPATGSPKSPLELSRGTREQLYLALRLGLAASYGEQVAQLPLVLDDVAVNFDPERQAALCRVLGRFAAEHGRQVLLFTCHPAFVALGRAAGTPLRVVDLGAQSAQAEIAAGAPLAQRILDLLGPGPLGLRELAALAAEGEEVVRRTLRALLAEGRLEAVGSGRGRRYRAVG